MSAAGYLDGFGQPYWLDMERPAFPRLEGETAADVAVIGAGIAGLKLGRALARYSAEVVILDGARVGDGASGRNEGAIVQAPNMSYAAWVERHGRDLARDLWRLGLENHRLIRAEIEEYGIACDYQPEGSTSLARRDTPGFETDLAEFAADCPLLVDDGFRVVLLDEKQAIERTGNPLFAGGIGYLDDAQFHSGKYVVGLAQGVSGGRGVRLFERSRVLSVADDGRATRVATERGAVTAGRVFLTVNALAPQLVPSLEDSLRAERGQVLVTAPLPEKPCRGSFGTAMAWWRAIVAPDGRHRLLFGGGRRRDEPDSLFRQFDGSGAPHPRLEREGFSPSEAHQRRLDAEFGKIFPSLRGVPVTHRWGGLQSFTGDLVPLAGVFDPARRVHGIAGFCGRGNTYASVGAEYLAGKAAGVVSDVERRFGHVFEGVLAVGRPSARWGAWTTSND